jgi:hypothetical protein
MFKALLSRVVTGFEKTWNYDATYMRELLDAGSGRFLRFMMIPALGRGDAAPAAALAAAGIAGTLSEDCGPCTQIGVDMATKGGVKPEVLRAILSGDQTAMGPDASLAYRFASASLARDMERADPLREEIVRRWGKKGLVDIGLAIMTARMYPTLKYALGHGKACSRVVVAGAPTPVHHLEPLAA